MPSKQCSGVNLCNAHRQQKEDVEKDVQEFVIIGNGPSGICLSYLLSGNMPYYVGQSEDEMLHARLSVQPDQSLVEQDLEFLAEGLEGRSNNPVSLLLDCLQHPQADLGLDLPSHLQWRQEPGTRVKHVVLGRGKPGGVWQTLNGNLKTVSLGAWMQLPNLSMPKWQEHNTKLIDRRTSVSNVAQYYTDYVDIMGISNSFRNCTVVSSVKQVRQEKSSCRSSPPRSSHSSSSSRSHASDSITASTSSSFSRHLPDNAAPHPFTDMEEADDMFSFEEDELSSVCSSLTHASSASPSRDLSTCRFDEGCEDRVSGQPSEEDSNQQCRGCSRESSDVLSCLQDNCDTGPAAEHSSMQYISIPGYDTDLCPSWDPIINPSLFSCVNSYRGGSFRNSFSCSFTNPHHKQLSCVREEEEGTLFEVSGYELERTAAGQRTTTHFKYLTKNVVLATGLDNPNRLNVEGEDLSFVIHSLRDVETAVEVGGLTPNSDPILIIGAGLSAADAIITAQGYNIPVVHVFRRAVDDQQLIFNKLPVNLYPEYHDVHKMMAEGSVESPRKLRGEQVDREHPKYVAYAQTVVTNISKDRRVTLSGPHTNTDIQVSYVLVLIGASPNLEFLESATQLGRVDKNNPLNIDVYTHQSLDIPGLFAMGPLTGDNFVRFLQGGALAIASFAHKQRSKRKKEQDEA